MPGRIAGSRVAARRGGCPGKHFPEEMASHLISEKKRADRTNDTHIKNYAENLMDFHLNRTSLPCLPIVRAGQGPFFAARRRRRFGEQLPSGFLPPLCGRNRPNACHQYNIVQPISPSSAQTSGLVSELNVNEHGVNNEVPECEMS